MIKRRLLKRFDNSIPKYGFLSEAQKYHFANRIHTIFHIFSISKYRIFCVFLYW